MAGNPVTSRSHALRGNVLFDALRRLRRRLVGATPRRGASEDTVTTQSVVTRMVCWSAGALIVSRPARSFYGDSAVTAITTGAVRSGPLTSSTVLITASRLGVTAR